MTATAIPAIEYKRRMAASLTTAMISERIGRALRARRETLRLSQEAFADKVAMHRTYYSAIERGEKNVTMRILFNVAYALDTTIEQIMKDAQL